MVRKGTWTELQYFPQTGKKGCVSPLSSLSPSAHPLWQVARGKKGRINPSVFPLQAGHGGEEGIRNPSVFTLPPHLPSKARRRGGGRQDVPIAAKTPERREKAKGYVVCLSHPTEIRRGTAAFTNLIFNFSLILIFVIFCLHVPEAVNYPLHCAVAYVSLSFTLLNRWR